MRKTNRFILMIVGLFCLMLFGTSPVYADVVLRWTPDDQTIDIDDTLVMSLMLDDPIEVRTIEIWIEYDTEVVSSISGGFGDLFDSFPVLFTSHVEETPGLWHGYSVVISALEWTSGPGELFTWTVSGLAGGVCTVSTVSVRMFGPDGEIEIADVSLPSTTIIVDNSSQVSPDAGIVQTTLDLFPNPFNPGTELHFNIPVTGQTRIEVFSTRGALVATAFDSWVDAGALTVPWNGRDQAGQQLASGVYLFRLVGPQGVSATSRGILLK